MTYLLDTQILLWVFGEFDKIPEDVLKIIRNQKNELLVCKASFWEIAIKLKIGKLNLPVDPETLNKKTLSNNISILTIELSHILKTIDLPFHHRDPFDRLIISQATVEKIPVISSDRQFALYDVELVI